MCFWDGNGKPVNAGPLKDLIARIDCYKLVTSMEQQASIDICDLNIDLNLNTNWDNGLLANYVGELHIDDDEVSPAAEFPLGRGLNQLVVTPSVSQGPSVPTTEAIAPVLEPSALFNQILGPSTGEDTIGFSTARHLPQLTQLWESREKSLRRKLL